MNKEEVVVTIWCLAYNQRAYISQCLDGFVMQKTNFKFVALVHDDASTDGTDVIIREYAEQYPDIIKPIFETENQYSKHNGALDRYLNGIKSKYIAVCEGDDYWIDPLKLQKQYDLLESDISISMCHHNYYKLYGNGRMELRKAQIPQRQDIYSIAKSNKTQTLTMFFRNINPLIPAELLGKKDVYTAFWAMRLAEIGDIYYINEPMAVYRFNEGGIFGMQKAMRKFEMATSNIDTMIYWNKIRHDDNVVVILKKRAKKVCQNYFLHFIKRLDFKSAYLVFIKRCCY